jgi:hypothetical protein
MELWNKDNEFRKEYIRCNTRSTLRRLRTLDGRSLGPDEEPPVIPYFVNERVARDNSVSLQSAAEQEKQNVQVEAEKVKEKSIAKAVEQKNETTKSKRPVKPAPLGSGLATISGRDVIEEAREEERKVTKEEEELARKAEELRREEEAAKLREQQLLEERAKAKEALERKRRNAEKAQARASLKAQREAEQKEKVNSTNCSQFHYFNYHFRVAQLYVHMPLFFFCVFLYRLSMACGLICRKGKRKQGRRKKGRLAQ